ncbi:hypothetical protein UPYG_G00128500 [Umbra pygmaea]|uniref:Uncharacterized protein n=1 Tax=Umbra pygmaea TaxID=75934 RepID=A0ABD0XA16_UMBPY
MIEGQRLTDTMSFSQSPILLLLLASGSWANHFFGGTMTFNPRGTNPDGTFRVEHRYKTSLHSCSDLGYYGWSCYLGDCGTQTNLLVQTVDQETSGNYIWCQREGVMNRSVSSNTKTFDLYFEGGNWMYNDNSIGFWRLLTHVDLGIRSDKGKVNRSPQTTVIPVMRVPVNCPKDFKLLSFDPDGDEVNCRYAVPSDECYTPSSITSSNVPLDFTIQTASCTLSFSSQSNKMGMYAVQMMMEDFPAQSISLSYTDGSQSSRTPGDTLSKLPVQFAIIVDLAVPSCTDGEYLPLFLSPTPAQGAVLYTSTDQPLEITVKAQATQSMVSELLVSGPQRITESTTGPGVYRLKWTPNNDEEGGFYPVCFIAVGVNGSFTYHSELRCVIVKAGRPIKTTVTHITTPDSISPTNFSSTTELIANPTTELKTKLTTTQEPAATGFTYLSNNNFTTKHLDNSTVKIERGYTVRLSMQVSSLTSLKDYVFLQQLREELTRLGLPGAYILRLNAIQQICP